MYLAPAVAVLALALVLNALGGTFGGRRPPWLTERRVAWTLYVLAAGLAVNVLFTLVLSKEPPATAGARLPGPDDAAAEASPAAPLSPRAMIRQAVRAALAAHDVDASRDPPSPGHSLYAVVTFELPTRARDNYVFDTEDARGTRVSLYMTADDVLTYRVSDRARAESLQVHAAAGTFAFGRPSYVACAYGSTRTYSFLRMRIDGREVQYRKTERLSVIDPKASFSFGADIRNGNQGALDFSGYREIKGTTLTAEEERQLLEKESAAVGIDEGEAGARALPP